MRSDSVYEASNITKVNILNGEIEVEQFYCDLVNAMIAFFDKLVKLSIDIGILIYYSGCPISKDQIERFYDLNRKCDDHEDKRVRSKLNHITNESINITSAGEFNIEKDNRVVRGCCTAECCIF